MTDELPAANKHYVEPTPRTRQIYFLALALIGGLALLADNLDRLLPPLPPISEAQSLTAVLEQRLWWMLYGALFSTTLFLLASIAAFHYTQRIVRSQQWPPLGTSVPFRTEVRVLLHPWKAWAYLCVVLCTFAVQIAWPWYFYVAMRSSFEEIVQSLEVSKDPNDPQSAASEPAQPK